MSLRTTVAASDGSEDGGVENGPSSMSADSGVSIHFTIKHKLPLMFFAAKVRLIKRELTPTSKRSPL